ncbi:hypothetical protein KSS87_002143 [Heliosperma pusillum]|nr:hypothetical protein KSS87_002143 [Heliosperma pusillum]
MAERDDSQKTMAKTPWMSPNSPREENESNKLWGIVIFSFIGAAATTMAEVELGNLCIDVTWSTYCSLCNACLFGLPRTLTKEKLWCDEGDLERKWWCVLVEICEKGGSALWWRLGLTEVGLGKVVEKGEVFKWWMLSGLSGLWIGGHKLGGIGAKSNLGRMRKRLSGRQRDVIKIGQLRQFGRTINWFSVQMSKMQSGKGGTGSFRSSFQQEARRKYRQRMQEEYEEEMERVERIRRMQSVFNRERNKHQRGYESWREHGPSGGPYHQNAQREDWYWTSDSSFKERKTNYRYTPQHPGNYSLSRHYAVLGLERSRVKPYTDDEIKTAFRAKALEYHPDQNQDNKGENCLTIAVAEAKFKEVMVSYEAIKSERKNLK